MAELQILHFWELGFSSVKLEFVKVILRRDVFVILLTGFGRVCVFSAFQFCSTECFQMMGVGEWNNETEEVVHCHQS